jgi:hypothetical protein
MMNGCLYCIQGYDTEEDAARQRTEQDMNVSRHTAELHA